MTHALRYGLLSAGRRRRSLVLPGLTVAAGAFLLVLVVALMPAVRRAGATFGDAAAVGRATLVISAIVVLLGVLEVAITATRSIVARVREIGVLCTFGVSPRSVVCALLVEPVLTAAAGALAGATAAALVALAGTGAGLVDASVAAGTVLAGWSGAVALSTVAALAVSAAPAWRAVRRPPLVSLTT
jgi:ABC-type lipoprotein release transport system permease subunit